MQFHFADQVLDVARRELRRRGQAVTLEPQVFDLLVHLIRNRDRVVSKDDLLDSVWGRADRFRTGRRLYLSARIPRVVGYFGTHYPARPST